MSTSHLDQIIEIIDNEEDQSDLLSPLLSSDIDINSTIIIKINGVNHTHSLLTYACYLNRTKIALLLIQHNADPNYQSKPDEESPLFYACSKLNTTVIASLLELPAINLHLINKNSDTCLSIALRLRSDIYQMIFMQMKRKKNEAKPKTKQLNEKEKEKEKEASAVIKHKEKVNVKKIRKMFPMKPRGDNIIIPFSFKEANDDKGKSLNYHIKLSSNPTVNIDLNTIDNYSSIIEENRQLRERNDYLEQAYKELLEENQQLKQEVEEVNIKLEAVKEERNNLKCSAEWNLSQNNNISQRSSNNTGTHSLSNGSLSPNDYLHLKFKSSPKKDISALKTSLQKDLIDYKDYTNSNVIKDQELLNELLSLLQYAVNEISQDYEVKLYGSRATKLCLLWSDLDVVLIPKSPLSSSNNPSPVILLDLLSNSLNSKLWVNSLKYINTAKIPIIKLTSTEKYSFMQIDISIKDSTHCGLECVELVKSYIAKYESLEPIVLTIKTLLKLSALNDPFTGGLSSYGIVLMVVAFLKNEALLGHSIALENIGHLFWELLVHYGAKSYTNYVNVNDSNMQCSLTPFELRIIDPLNQYNNIGKSASRYIEIKLMFMIALQSLSDDCPCGCHYMNTPSLNHPQNDDIQHNTLKKMFNAVKRLNTTANHSN